VTVAVEREKPWLELYRYWLGKHVDGRPPARRDLDPPLEIPALVARLMLIELVDGEFMYRLAGSEIARYLSADLTGRAVGGSAWAPEQVRSEWRRMITTVTDRQRPHMAITLPARGNSRTGFCLALPLVDGNGATEQVLIGIFSDRAGFGSKELDGIDVFEFEP
jgi:hypothetical protein